MLQRYSFFSFPPWEGVLSHRMKVTIEQLKWTFCRPSTTSTDVSIASISFAASSELMSCQFWQSAILSLRPFLSRRTLERNADTVMTCPLIGMHSRERAVGENSEAHRTRHPEVLRMFSPRTPYCISVPNISSQSQSWVNYAKCPGN